MCLADVLLPMDPLADSSAANGGPLLHRPSASSLADSDEFRMYNAKILPCRKRYHHDWNECIFSHVGEKVQRRCPRKFNYMGIMCPDMKKFNQCPKDDECCFAHNSFEYWLHPTRYRTEMCTFGPACKRCVCFFAHTPEQLRGYGKTTLAGTSSNQAGFPSCEGYNPGLRTPVVVGNRLDFEPSGGMADAAGITQEPYNFYASQPAHPPPRALSFSPDLYASSMDPYSPVASNTHRLPSPIAETYPVALQYTPISGALPTRSLQLATSTPLPSAHLATAEDPFDTSARFISMLASRAAPTTHPTPASHPALLHAYSPSPASHPNPSDPIPHSPAGSNSSSHSSGGPTLSTTPPGITSPRFFADASPQAQMYVQPSHQLPLPSLAASQTDRFSPSPSDLPLAFLPPDQPLTAADLLADRLADAQLAHPTSPSSRTRSRRPSLHTPISDSRCTRPASPSQLIDPNQHGPDFVDATTANAQGPASVFACQHHQPSAVLGSMAARAKAVGSHQRVDYRPQAVHYQQYRPQLSTGLAAVDIPHQLHSAQVANHTQLPWLYPCRRS